jgi:ketosteroid isomerase-like protein
MRAFCAALAVLLGVGLAGRTQAAGDARAGIEAFNRALDQATLRMDNAATLALWEDDGVSLLPATAPMVGKPALAAFLRALQRQHPKARMQSFESHCHDIQSDGRLASEWCDEHQVVSFGDGTPPFDGRGKMLLVLHRGDDGRWRLRQEMWTQAAPPPH